MSSQQPSNPQPSPQPNKPEDNKNFKDKLSETLDSLKKNEKIDGLYQYASANTRDTIAYIILILGLILVFFYSFWGGLLVGLVAGIYFSDEINYIIKNVNQIIEQQGMVRSLVLGGTLLALFILAPSVFVGIAIAVALKMLIIPK